MKKILHSLHSVVGVEGTFLSDVSGKILASTCPDKFDVDALSKIAYALNLGMRLSREKGNLPKSIYGTFAQGRVVVRPFDKGVLVVMGTMYIKQLLLRVALDDAIKKISDILTGIQKTHKERELEVIVGKVRVDQALMDVAIVDEWRKDSKSASAIKQVELQTPKGVVAMLRIKTKKGLGQVVQIHSSALKELGLVEGENVIARPVMRVASEVEEFFG